MPTLSTRRSLAAAFKKERQSGRGRDLRGPSHSCFQLLVAVTGLFPVGIPAATVENRGQLLFGPRRIPLPQPAQRIADYVRNVKRCKLFNVLLIQAEESAAGG